jgi:DNA polymerase delta subunit 1
MPAATIAPQKRVLGDSTKANRNVTLSPNSSKKRKLDTDLLNAAPRSSQNGPKSKLGSSQPKSQFESEVLEKLTQDINGLKRANSEKDQQWDRPSLDDFDEKRDALCFQQIEAEEGTIHGGKTTIKLFGVTEVS